jgi:membrane fusion protein, multidrug efflux system
MNIKDIRKAGACLIIIVLFSSGCGRAAADSNNEKDTIRPVKAVLLKPAPSERRILFPGTAKVQKEVNLSFRVTGPLTNLLVDDGMKVKKGDLLARIDIRDFTINVKTLKAKLAASKAQYNEAKLQYVRYQNLVKANAASKSVYDQVEAAYEMATAQVDADTQNLESAENALTDTVIYAPFNGYVDKVFVDNHETVNQGQTVISLVDLSHMEVEISLPETLLSKTDDFKIFKCAFEAIPNKVFMAKIKEIGKMPNPSNRSYPLTLKLDNLSENGIRPGMAVDVSAMLTAKKTDKIFIVPVSSLVNLSAERTIVWIMNQEKGVVEKRNVQVMGLLKSGAEITGNVVGGEWLITAGAHHLSEGQPVRLAKKPSATNVGSIL